VEPFNVGDDARPEARIRTITTTTTTTTTTTMDNNC
jgi:hypothetical protein